MCYPDADCFGTNLTLVTEEDCCENMVEDVSYSFLREAGCNSCDPFGQFLIGHVYKVDSLLT